VSRAESAPPSGPRRLAVYDEAVTLQDLSRGRTRLALIRDMAMNELSDKELAFQIGCDVPTIKAFRAVYATEIAEVTAALAGHLAIESAGLWTSKKANRVAEMQSDVEVLNKAMLQFMYTADGEFYPMAIATREFDRMMRAKHFALAQIASEYALADKAQGTTDPRTTRYIIEMDDDLREALS
jgi:hypothetical protein